jgi:hypothetical protein
MIFGEQSGFKTKKIYMFFFFFFFYVVFVYVYNMCMCVINMCGGMYAIKIAGKERAQMRKAAQRNRRYIIEKL